MVRAGNEDTFLVLNLDTSDTWTPVTIEDDPPEHLSSFEPVESGAILAVSDGMGGALAGEVASRMAVEGVREHMLLFKTHDTFSTFPFHEQLRLAVEQANTHINNESVGNADYAGMGATFTAAGVHDGALTLAQIGDSRCYLVRDNHITLMTHDQSLVWQLVEAGHITEEEAETHQYKNVILQALGAQPRVNVVVDRFDIHQGDTILLCSDGLSGRVRSEEMLDIVTKSPSLKQACESLIQLANNRGGEDNITVVLARFEGESLPPAGEVQTERIERDPNLPYDVDDELFLEIESTLTGDDAKQSHGSDDGASPAVDPSVTTFLTPPVPLGEDAVVAASDSGEHEITPEIASHIAKLNERADVPVATSVGLPALTADMIAEHSKSAAKPADSGKADLTGFEKPHAGGAEPEPERAMFGPTIIVTLLAGALVLLGYYLYQHQAEAALQREQTLAEATAIDIHVQKSKRTLVTLAANIETLQPGPDHDEAVRLRESVQKKIDEVGPLVEPNNAKPESVRAARDIVTQIDADMSRITSIVEKAVAQPPASPSPEDHVSPS
ncbi:MAG TPA: protein phosphatase 2C domain-containing protein [Blastocatellia bacterium]|nr:protein phosphatase 2C domain-containing protein [Blastocatellia bacterium]